MTHQNSITSCFLFARAVRSHMPELDMWLSVPNASPSFRAQNTGPVRQERAVGTQTRNDVPSVSFRLSQGSDLTAHNSARETHGLTSMEGSLFSTFLNKDCELSINIPGVSGSPRWPQVVWAILSCQTWICFSSVPIMKESSFGWSSSLSKIFTHDPSESYLP